MNRAWLESRLPTDIRWVDPLKPEHADYCVALSRANSYAHDGTPEPGTQAGALGMPRWVLLDFCLLPTAVVGFEAHRERIPADIAALLDPSGQLEWLAVSEYVAVPSVEPGRHVGVSLFSLIEGGSLGVRSKALGLRALGGTELIGVTQYTNAGVAVHLRFGPLAIVTEEVAVHSRPRESFVYRLDVPPGDELRAIAEGAQKRADTYEPAEWRVERRFDPRDEFARAEAMRYIEEAPTWVLEHGPIIDGEVSELALGRPR